MTGSGAALEWKWLIKLDVEDIVTRLNGALLRKAEMHDNSVEFYTSVFERLAVFSVSEEVEILELFGSMGG